MANFYCARPMPCLSLTLFVAVKNGATYLFTHINADCFEYW